MKNYIIFFDNDGVTSSWSTWGNDINLFEDKRLKDIDIYIDGIILIEFADS